MTAPNTLWQPFQALTEMPVEQTEARPKKPTPRRRGASKSVTERREAATRAITASPHPMTVRQLYYRLVSDGTTQKTDPAYGALVRDIKTLREQGRVPWSKIVDHTRPVYQPRTWDDTEALLKESARLYRRNLMAMQPVAIQLWAESDSIGSVIQQRADEYCVPTFIGRGYVSRGYLWDAATEAVAAHRVGKTTHILHVGDFDPSGEDIYRDVAETLSKYALAINHRRTVADIDRLLAGQSATAYTKDWLSFTRLAVTPEQIAQYDLPSRPPKATDTRTARFTGTGTVEVEALPVEALLQIVENAITELINPEQLRIERLIEQDERESFTSFVDQLIARSAPS